MHLLGKIISVHFKEKERYHALKYSRVLQNSKARLQHLEMTGIYLTGPINKTGIICMSYLLYSKKWCEWSLVCEILY